MANLWHSIEQIDSQLENLKATQAFLYFREQRHRLTVESTASRVVWYATARGLLLVAVSVGQVLFIRRLFKGR